MIKTYLPTITRARKKNRLRTDLGHVEFARTKELLLEFLPPAPAVVYDIGGAYGEYSWFLSSLGYTVSLFDISETNILMSADLQGEYPGVSLASAEVADARSILRPSGSADAILLMGPLYHIVEREGRYEALKEALRLLKPGGRLFAGVITRFATTLWAMSVYCKLNRLLDEPEFVSMIEREVKDGQHFRPEHSAYKGLGRSFFHHPKEIDAELFDAGFRNIDVRGVLGCGWLAPGLDELWKDEKSRESILRVVRMLEKEESLMGLSTHLLAVAEK